jgi:hypothetical protein
LVLKVFFFSTKLEQLSLIWFTYILNILFAYLLLLLLPGWLCLPQWLKMELTVALIIFLKWAFHKPLYLFSISLKSIIRNFSPFLALTHKTIFYFLLNFYLFCPLILLGVYALQHPRQTFYLVSFLSLWLWDNMFFHFFDRKYSN